MDENKTKVAKELGVSRSSLYYKPQLPDKDELLKTEIEKVMLLHSAYGHRRIADELKINRKRISRVMKKYSLKPARRAKTPQKESSPKADFPNVIQLLSPIAPSEIWAADFTYISFQGSFIYFATVVDLFTKEVLGFAVKTSHDTSLILEALDMALATAETTPTWFHNDRGSEYRSQKFEDLLTSLNIKISISPRPWFNGCQESFYGRFKTEFGDPERYDSLPELIEAICFYVHYYNNFRIHTRIRMSPIEFKIKWQNNQKLNLPLGGDAANKLSSKLNIIRESLS